MSEHEVIAPDAEELRLRRIWGEIDLTDTEGLARRLTATLAENERLREALQACAGELAGGGMTKRGLTDALELARAALKSEEGEG